MPDKADSGDAIGLLREFWDRQHEADQKLGTNPAAAMKDAVQLALGLTMTVARYQPAHSAVPGVALRRLLAAFVDWEQGISDPALRPAVVNKGHHLGSESRYARVKPALAMELLIRAGRRWEEAAKEVVRMLGDNHSVFKCHSGAPWRIVARWRTDIASGDDPEAKAMFDDYLEWTTDFLREREGTADDLVRIARATLSRSA